MYLVVGPGAVGLTVAACLSQVADVRLVGRERMASPRRVVLEGDVHLTADLPQLSLAEAGREPGVVLLCVKTYHLEEVLPFIAHRDEPVVLCQNGIGIIERAQRIIPDASYARLLMHFGARLVSPGSVRVAGIPKVVGAAAEATPPYGARAACPELVEGSRPLERLIPAGETPALHRLENLCRDFQRAGCRAELADSVARIEWEKAALNLVTNTIATLLDAPNKTILESPQQEQLAQEVYSEVREVAAAAGVDLPGDPEDLRARIRAVGDNINSTLVDLRAGRRTELDAFCGTCLKVAREHGVAMPKLEGLVQQLREKGAIF